MARRIKGVVTEQDGGCSRSLAGTGKQEQVVGAIDVQLGESPLTIKVKEMIKRVWFSLVGIPPARTARVNEQSGIRGWGRASVRCGVEVVSVGTKGGGGRRTAWVVVMVVMEV